ncbi:MAG: OmpA family protein [Flavobacteriales bacterium]
MIITKSLIHVKPAILISFLVLLANEFYAQNLVPNPSFEEHKYCPTTYNQTSLTLLEGWRQASDGTPDYFNACSKKAGVPNNIFGQQPAKSGEGYTGLVTFASSKRDYREYLYAPLNRKLSAGEKVCIELFVSPADDSRFVNDGIGVKLSKKKLNFLTDKVIDIKASMEGPELYFVDGYDQWILLSSEYTATGGERFITIGNFKPDSELNVLKRTTTEEIAANNWAYTYLDSVVVKPIQSKSECSCTNEILSDLVHDPPLQLKDAISMNIESVLFDFDDDAITTEAEVKLLEVSKLLLRNSNIYIEINGHTDIIGREGYNTELSQRRALSVQRFLETKGIDVSRLAINYHGSSVPVAENDSAEGRAQNRRVMFEILEKSYLLHSSSQR